MPNIGSLKRLKQLQTPVNTDQEKNKEGTNNQYQEEKERHQYRSCQHNEISPHNHQNGYYQKDNK